MPQDKHASGGELLPLFPPIEPFATGRLDLDPPHRMYFEQSGNPQGIPVVVLHGGPGAGASAVHRQFFDPAAYRIVVYDQRGAGRSSPLGCIENNTTPKLVEDLERLRTHLGIDKWVVFGGSWGSTLAIAYAQAHPQRVRGLVLRGLFLATDDEVRWFLVGLARFLPEAWSRFAAAADDQSWTGLLRDYEQRVRTGDARVLL